MKTRLTIMILLILGLSQLSSGEVKADPGILSIRNDATGGDCTTVGVWDGITKTCTLTTDVAGTIQIDSDNITLDGNGHTVTAGKSTGGLEEVCVYVPYLANVTVKNITVSDSTYGILASDYYTSLTLTNNVIKGNSYGVHFWASSGLLIENNTFIDNSYGLWVTTPAVWGVVEGNTFISGMGVAIEGSPGGIFRDNYVDGLFYLAHSGNSLVVNNTIQNGGLILFDSPDNQIYNNNFLNCMHYSNNPTPIVDETSISTFNLAEPIGGNYWSNFDQPDEGCSNADGDSFCDAPYVFPNGNGQDGLPWAKPDGWVVTTVSIDVKPGSDSNSINPKSNGVIPVAILTTANFDAASVDPLSVKFGPNGAMEAHGQGHHEDVDGDGDLDLLLHFKTAESGIQCGDTTVSLTGVTYSGQAITGSDAIEIVGCE
jgi:parallel beta-helix repeat protein